MTEISNDDGTARRYPLRYVARVTIEFTTPFTVRSVANDPLVDSVFVTDANGLPALPGSSIAGVLRHALQACRDENTLIDSVFGAPIRGGNDTDGGDGQPQGAGSRLSISWAAIHDARNRPVDGLIDGARAGDPVLAAARTGVLRDHVRIDHKGAAENTGKFEEQLVGAGHRFTFELELHGTEDDEPAWRRILGLLKWPGLRFGAGTRRGFGAFRVLAIRARTFDLRDEGDFSAYAGLPIGLGEEAGFPDATAEIEELAAAHTVTATLKGFRPAEPWVFGGGVPRGGEDITPVTETLVTWQGDRGAVLDRPVQYLPASSIKGVLAHRLAWHFNRRAGKWASTVDPCAVTGSANPAVRALLGTVKGAAGNGDQPGRRGVLLLDDVFLTEPVPDRTVMHVAIDRFSGGVRAGALFEERVLQPESWRTDYRIMVLDADDLAKSFEADLAHIKTALDATLRDIRKGRLAFGAGGGRGNGGFVCDKVVWSDDGDWVRANSVSPADRQGDAA